MEYAVHTGEQGLERVRGAWEALEPRGAQHVFQRYDYVRRWYDTIGQRDGSTPLIVERTEAGETTAIFPACRVKQGPARLLTWMGGPDLVDYGDIVCDPASDGATAREFVSESLRRLRPHARGALTYLTNVREDATAFHGLNSVLREFSRSTAPYVVVDGDMDEFMARLPKARRQNTQRCIRRLEERGRVEFRWLEPDDPELPGTVERLIELKKARYNRPGATTELFKPGHPEFCMACALQDPAIRIGRLLAGDILVAEAMMAVYRGRMYLLASAFEAEFERCSPGRVLAYHLLRDCHEQQLGIFDFCWGDEPYKYEWTASEVPLVTFVDRGPGGMLLETAAKARRAANRRAGARKAAHPEPAS